VRTFLLLAWNPVKNSAVIFDLDGTLTKPYLDFDAIRKEIGVTGPILEAIEHFTGDERLRADSILARHEWDAARNAALYEGAAEVVAECRARGFPVAIMTRNARPTACHVLDTFGIAVDAIRTREDGAIKPSPEPVFDLCRQLDADPRKSWVVGDFRFDILSGRAAGTRTVLMVGDDPVPDYAHGADHVIRRLAELLPLLGQAAE